MSGDSGFFKKFINEMVSGGFQNEIKKIKENNDGKEVIFSKKVVAVVENRDRFGTSTC